MANTASTATRNFSERIAVCSWSLQPGNPKQLIDLLRETGISRTQLALDPILQDPNVWGEAPSLLAGAGIRIVSGMFGTEGEDYTSLESIRLTGGIVPDGTWEKNRGHMEQTALLARRLGLGLVTFHAGFVPHEKTAPGYGKLVGRLTEAATIFTREGIQLGLETGQESASALADLLRDIAQPGLGVNFDPANMILYDKGDPVEAVEILGPWIRQVHIKDALPTAIPGTWGQEVPAGQGGVNWARFFNTLQAQEYTGDLVIEREAGTCRAKDIRIALALVQGHLAV